LALVAAVFFILSGAEGQTGAFRFDISGSMSLRPEIEEQGNGNGKIRLGTIANAGGRRHRRRVLNATLNVRLNPNKERLVFADHGEIYYHVGPIAPRPAGELQFQMATKKFTVSYPAKDCDLTTEFLHVTKAIDGTVPIAASSVIVP
jgi:hypothetical protein